MKKLDSMEGQPFLFGAIFVAANKMDTLLEREFKAFDVTTKQWFLSIVIDNLFDTPPTMKEAAREMGSSHQNIKQLALKLEQKGLLILEKDPKDSRITRLKLSETGSALWNTIREEGAVFTKALFKDIPEADIDAARRVMKKLLSNLSEMDGKNREDSRHGYGSTE